MTVVDYLIIASLIISMLYGVIRGFFKEVISLASWILGVWAAINFASTLAPALVPAIPFIGKMEFFAESLLRQTVLCGAIIFFGFAFAGALINFIISRVVEKTGLGGMDRFLGMLFGAARGVLIVSVIGLFIMHSPVIAQEPVWANAKFRPYVEKISKHLENALPDSLLAYLPGRDESYGMLNGVQQQLLSAHLKAQGIDLTTVDLTEIEIESIDLSGLDSEALEPEKAIEYLKQLQRHQIKNSD